MILGCGHQCPGLCGEPCAESYCQECGSKPDQRVDLLEFKAYKDINLDETPIVVLSCGHFFTAESLDGLTRLGDVYSSDPMGRFVGLLEPSALLPLPRCPDCQTPLRQFATMRYNRIVNAAVLDETAQRFFVKGCAELNKLEKQISVAETRLETHWSDGKENVQSAGESRLFRRPLGTAIGSDRHKEFKLLERQVSRFCQAISIEQQPSKKLFDAILEARARQPLDARLAGLVLNDPPKLETDTRVILGGQLARFRIQAAILADQLQLLTSYKVAETATQTDATSGQSPQKSAMSMLKDCKVFVEESSANNLPRLAIRGSLIYANIAKCINGLGRSRVETSSETAAYMATAKTLLEKGEQMCDSHFEGAEKLRKDIEGAQRLLGRAWYEPVTKEETAAIRKAMIDGPSGIATHSGHWYKCANGHIVSD